MDHSDADKPFSLDSGDVLSNEAVQEDDYHKLKKLVEKTTKMRLEAPEHNRQADEYFKTLRQKLDESSAFLKMAKNNIDNIKTLFEQDHINNMNSQTYLDNVDKTDEEIEEEMKIVQKKLEELQDRIRTLKEDTNSQSRTFEEAVNDTISTLDNIGKEVHDTTKET